jgi:hypothetical protein
MDSLIINPIALFKDEFHCSLIDQSVSTGGTKHSLYSKDTSLANAIIDANCSGEPFCKLSLKSTSCPKKTNLNEV